MRQKNLGQFPTIEFKSPEVVETVFCEWGVTWLVVDANQQLRKLSDPEPSVPISNLNKASYPFLEKRHRFGKIDLYRNISDCSETPLKFRPSQ